MFTDPAGPEHQEYLNLISAGPAHGPHPDGVAEAQNRPVLYFVDNTRLMQTEDAPEQVMAHIRGKLACRGEAPTWPGSNRAVST